MKQKNTNSIKVFTIHHHAGATEACIEKRIEAEAEIDNL